MTFVKDGLLRDAELSLSLTPDITVQQMVGGRLDRMSVKLIPEIERIGGVKTAVPRVWGFVPISIDKNRSAVYTLMGIDLASTPVPDKIGMAIEKGDFSLRIILTVR